MSDDNLTALLVFVVPIVCMFIVMGIREWRNK